MEDPACTFPVEVFPGLVVEAADRLGDMRRGVAFGAWHRDLMLFKFILDLVL
jgi:hypothetical protein